MKVRDVMSDNAKYISSNTTLKDAAQEMRELGCGFLPIGNSESDKLRGVITDRDIVIRGMAAGMNPETATVDEVKSEKVLYCFQDDDLEKAASSMHDQQVYRLIVLDNSETKKLCGVISLGDITRHRQASLASKASEGILAAA